MANFLIDQKGFHVCTLVATQLNHFARLFVFLHSTVAAKVLLEGFADALNVQVVRQTSHGGDTLSSTSLLHTDVNLVGRCGRAVPGVLECVYMQKQEACVSVKSMESDSDEHEWHLVSTTRSLACCFRRICLLTERIELKFC